ncbi:MAG: hypothetical protein H6705_05940 [Myxococcales bacterium]|nr:hypothetical protein [Myxococcales bacterium]
MKTMATLALLAGVSMTSVGCGPPPKVMVDHGFLGQSRTVKLLMQRNAAGTFDQSIRVCTLAEGKETACKDTVVLENVTPGSLY